MLLKRSKLIVLNLQHPVISRSACMRKIDLKTALASYILLFDYYKGVSLVIK